MYRIPRGGETPGKATMPVYEYECERCGAKTELLRPMREMDKKASCGKCGSTKTRRAQSVFSPGSGSAGENSGPMPGACAHCHEAGGSCPMGR
jgi:putative FmdB family regulatory protein